MQLFTDVLLVHGIGGLARTGLALIPVALPRRVARPGTSRSDASVVAAYCSWRSGLAACSQHAAASLPSIVATGRVRIDAKHSKAF